MTSTRSSTATRLQVIYVLTGQMRLVLGDHLFGSTGEWPAEILSIFRTTVNASS